MAVEANKTRVSVTVTNDDPVVAVAADADEASTAGADDGDVTEVSDADTEGDDVEAQATVVLDPLKFDKELARHQAPAVHTSRSNVNDQPPKRPLLIAGKDRDRVYTSFQVGSDDDLKPGQFKGHASVIGNEVDSWMLTVIESGSFSEDLDRIKKEEQNSFPILWQHEWSNLIGHSFHQEEDKRGLFLMAQLDTDVPDGHRANVQLKPHPQTGIASMRKMSIGFESEKERFEKKKNGDWVRYISKLRLWETSLVTFAADDKAWVAEAASAGGGMSWGSSPLDMLRSQVPYLMAFSAMDGSVIQGQDRETLRQVVTMLCELAKRGGGDPLFSFAQPESKAELLRGQLGALFATRESEVLSRNDLVAKVARQARCNKSVIEGVLAGNRSDVTADRLSAFALALATDVTELRRAAERDGIELNLEEHKAKIDPEPADNSVVDMSDRLREATLAHHSLTYGAGVDQQGVTDG